MIDRPVYPNVGKKLYCRHCYEITTMSEFEGQKEWHLFFIPLRKIGEPFRFLKCLQCLNDFPPDYNINQTTGQHSAIFRDLTAQEKNEKLRSAARGL